MLNQSTAGQLASQPAPTLILDRLPSGDLAWLRAEPTNEDRRYVLTQSGRDLLARERATAALFGPWPTVAEACA